MHSFTSHVSRHVSSLCGAGKLSMPPVIPPGRQIRNACSLRLGVPRAFLPFADFAFEPFIVNLSETQLHDRHISSTVPTVCFVFSNWEVLLYHHSVLFLFPFFTMYMCGMHVCVCAFCVCGGVRWTYVHMYTWKSKVGVRNHPQCLFYFIQWGRVSTSNPELTGTPSLADQVALGVPCLPPLMLEWQTGSHTSSACKWVSGDPNSDARIAAAVWCCICGVILPSPLYCFRYF